MKIEPIASSRSSVALLVSNLALVLEGLGGTNKRRLELHNLFVCMFTGWGKAEKVT